MFHRKLSLNLTGFTYSYGSLQVSSFVSQSSEYIVHNAGSARTTGADMTVAYEAARGLLLNAAITYDRAQYLSFPDASCYATQTLAQGCNAEGQQNLSGRPTLNAPLWSGDVGFNYFLPMGKYTLDLGADSNFSSSYYVITTENPHSLQGRNVRLNAHVRLASGNDRWAVSLIGRNLTNRAVMLNAQDTPLAGQQGNPYSMMGVLAPPREISLQVDYRFAP